MLISARPQVSAESLDSPQCCHCCSAGNRLEAAFQHLHKAMKPDMRRSVAQPDIADSEGGQAVQCGPDFRI